MPKITYWLNWKTKIITPSHSGLNNIPWSEVEKYPLTILCSHHDWPYIELEEKEKKIITDEEKRIYRIGLATIKEVRGGTEENREGLGSQALKKCWELCPNFITEHPSHSSEIFANIGDWVFPPRFENLQAGVFREVYAIDIKSCYANIMRNYPLPCGSPELITDPVMIEQKLREGKEGFVSFYLKHPARLKNNQIPFIPNANSKIEPVLKGRLILYTKLFRIFKKYYRTMGKIIYDEFWVFSEKSNCVWKFLDYCDQLKTNPQTEKQGKMLANAFYGAVGKSKFGGYNYRAWTLAVNHLAILQTYYLYRQFKTEQVLAIRSDCIYVRGELPITILKEANKYHIAKYNKVIFQGEENIFIVDTGELKARLVQGEERVKILTKLFEKDN